MNKEKNLIVFGEDWGRFPSSTQYIIQGLIKLGWNILWINSIGLRNPSFEWSYFKRLANKFTRIFFVKKKHKDSLPLSLTVLDPIVIPLVGSSFIDRINRFLLDKQLRCSAQYNNMLNPIVWTSLPSALPLLKIFTQCPIVYFCGDDFSVLGNVPQPQYIAIEEQLNKIASLVFVVNENLVKKNYATKTYYVDQAIDLNLFQKKYSRPVDLPKGKPIAGYYGTISEFLLDMDLIYGVVKALPTWNFVFFGPCDTDLSKLKKLDNFFYYNQKFIQEVPAYSQHWDVSLMPFVISQLTNAFNPLKLKEYLSSGKPIVSVNVSIVRPYKEFVYIAKNMDDFIKGIELSLGDEKQELRQDSVKYDGWDNRAITVDEKLVALLGTEGC